MKRFLCVLLCLVMCFSLIACSKNEDAIDPDSEEIITIVIPSGSNAVSISNLLVDNGIISDAKGFKNYLKDQKYDTKLQAGTYSLSPSMNFEKIADVLVNGKVAVKKFTIPEGLTLKQTAQKLADQGLGTYDEFIEYMTNGDFSKYEFIDESIGEKKLEGYLLPNTYTVFASYDYKDIVNFLLNQFNDKVYKVYKDKLDKYSMREMIIIASMIERETANDDDRYKVASVIYNRLNKNMRLRFCSTVQYILLETTGKVKSSLTYADLAIESPYNTYQNDGLPAGPICNPGIKSIDAAFNPADTNYLYFVLSDKLDGTSNFSETYAQHVKYAAAYNQAIKNQK